MSERFDLFFRAECLEGYTPDAVRSRLAILLELDDDALARLFAGAPVPVRRDVDRDTAARWQKAFRQAGARLRVRRAEPVAGVTPAAGSAGPEPRTVAAAVRPPGPSGDDPGRLSLAPVGADLLPASERRRAEPAQVSVEHLTLAPLDPGSLEPEETLTPPPPDTSGLELLPADAPETEQIDLAPPAPDVAHLSLRPPGSILTDGPPPPPPPAPDVTHLRLMEPDPPPAATAPLPGAAPRSGRGPKVVFAIDES